MKYFINKIKKKYYCILYVLIKPLLTCEHMREIKWNIKQKNFVWIQFKYNKQKIWTQLQLIFAKTKINS